MIYEWEWNKALILQEAHISHLDTLTEIDADSLLELLGVSDLVGW